MGDITERKKPHSVEEKLILAKEICRKYGTARYSIEAICKSFGISVSSFLKWAAPNIDAALDTAAGKPLPPGCVPQINEMYRESLLVYRSNYLRDLKEKAQSSLMRRITGFEYNEEHTEYGIDTTQFLPDGSPNPNYKKKVVLKTKTVTKVVVPDTTAIIFALTNVDSENFKHRQFNANINVTKDLDELEGLSDAELEQRLKETEHQLAIQSGKEAKKLK